MHTRVAVENCATRSTLQHLFGNLQKLELRKTAYRMLLLLGREGMCGLVENKGLIHSGKFGELISTSLEVCRAAAVANKQVVPTWTHKQTVPARPSARPRCLLSCLDSQLHLLLPTL